MSTREKAIQTIDAMPEDSDLTSIIRELSFLAGIEQAQEEIKVGEGLSANEAKARLRECLST